MPEAQRFVSKFWQDCNYLQALEGGVDPAHISFLHGILDARDDEGRRALDRAAAGFGFTAQLERTPHIEVADTETGLLIGARRDAPAGQYYWRITQYLLPFHTMPPPEVGERSAPPHPRVGPHRRRPPRELVRLVASHARHHRRTSGRSSTPDRASTSPTTRRRPARPTATSGPAASRANDYLADWEAQRTRKFFGVPGVGAQDKAITESQGVYDRSLERLGRADLGIIRVRKRLLDAAIALRTQATPPPGLDPATCRVRPASVLLPKDVPWVEGAKERMVAELPAPPAQEGRPLGSQPPADLSRAPGPAYASAHVAGGPRTGGERWRTTFSSRSRRASRFSP